MADEKKITEENKIDTMEEQTMSDYYAYAYWQNRPVIGAVLGTIRAFVDYVSRIIGTAAHNFLFPNHSHSTTGEAYREGYLKGKKEADKNKEVDKNREENDEKNKVKSPEEERKKEEAGLDSADRDQEACALLSDEIVKQRLEQTGIQAFPEKDSDRILLAFKNADGRRQNFGAASKTELIKGKADMLAASLYHHRLKEADGRDADIQKVKLEAALDAVIATAGISAYAYADAFKEADKEGDIAGIACVRIPVPDGAVEISITNDPKRPDTAVVSYNGKELCTCDIHSLADNGVVNRIKEFVRTENRAEQGVRHRIGNKDSQGFHGLEFWRGKNGKTVVDYRDGREKSRIGTYSFKSMKDVQALRDGLSKIPNRQNITAGGNISVDFTLKTDGEEHKVSGEVLAYTVAALSNPSMEQEVNSDGEYLNPISQQYEQGGAPYIGIMHDLYGVSFTQNIPDCGEMSRTVIGEYVNVSDIGMHDLNSLASAIQGAHDVNMRIAESGLMVEGHIRIKDGIDFSPVMDDADAKMVLQQNALDERTAPFIHSMEEEEPVQFDIPELQEMKEELENSDGAEEIEFPDR